MYSRTLRRIFEDYHKVSVGMYSYGCFRPGDIPQGTSIGRYCAFAPGVVIFNANHPLGRRSVHPFFYNASLGIVKKENIDRKRIDIGNDVWIGRNALITPRVSSIGDGAVVGAGAIVTKDVPDFAVVAGNPAKVIKYRFPENARQHMKDKKWWECSIEELSKDLDNFICEVADEDHECD